MPIENTCIECGRTIVIRKKNDCFLNKLLEESDVAVCKECDILSGWKVRKQK